jgi:hypothetical protein
MVFEAANPQFDELAHESDTEWFPEHVHAKDWFRPANQL